MEYRHWRSRQRGCCYANSCWTIGGPYLRTNKTPATWSTTPGPPHGVRRKEFVQWFPGEQAESSRRGTQLTAILRETGLLIGKCGIRRKSDSDWEADIGYEIAPDYWRRSYATEAAASLVEPGFTSMGLHRISSWCIAANGASIGVLRNLGMREEGRLRENEFLKGRWSDTLVFGLLMEEWAGSTRR